MKMKRSTVRLIHSIAYRNRLIDELPQLQERLLALLEDGQTLKTRRWAVRNDRGVLLIAPNALAPQYDQLPLKATE